MTITGSLIVSGSGTFTNIGPAVMSGSLNVSGSLTVGGSNVVLSNQTSSLNVLTASFASTASSADDLLVRGILTAQTLVVQTITSSIDYVTGSTRFGSITANTHQFTGSVSVSGSLIVSGTMGTGDLALNNQTIHPNEIDGTFGSWLIQEGKDDLFIINQLSGKKYKFNLIEIE
jgi:hypothetical protein